MEQRDALGYPSEEPCIVCERYDDNQTEPRFYYTVCKEHRWVPPVYLDKAKEEWNVLHTRKQKHDSE